jgi:cytoskeleton protein RodZ
MSEVSADAPVGGAPQGPGALLRRAREAQGMHIAALAAALKVPPAKLEALEHDRFDLLPDATFARALALAVCRALKLDPEPVLAQLPRASGESRLEHVATGLRTPFREHADASESFAGGALRNPVLWIVALLLLGAVAIYLWPQRPAGLLGESAGAAPASVTAIVGSTAEAPASSAEPVNVPAPSVGAVAGGEAATAAGEPEPPASAAETAPDAAPASNPAAELAAAASAPLVVRVRATSWVEVTDARRQTLLSRTVAPGEDVALDGTFPLRVTIGNAAATELVLRGRPVDLGPHVRDNIARLELQ